jgi:mRNA interferase MazF
MEKNFEKWHFQKEKIHYQSDNEGIYFHEGDIWWCRLGANVGDEQDDKGVSFSRPILIIKKFNRSLFWGVPLSAKLKNNPYYVICISKEWKVSSSIISQIRLLSAKRLTDKIGFAEDESLEAIRKAIRCLI